MKMSSVFSPEKYPFSIFPRQVSIFFRKLKNYIFSFGTIYSKWFCSKIDHLKCLRKLLYIQVNVGMTSIANKITDPAKFGDPYSM